MSALHNTDASELGGGDTNVHSHPVEDTSNDAALAAFLAREDEEEENQHPERSNSSTHIATSNETGVTTTTTTTATSAAPWQLDDWVPNCTGCHEAFHVLFNRRHHCRLCGHVFCQSCTHRKTLLPPHRIVLQPLHNNNNTNTNTNTNTTAPPMAQHHHQHHPQQHHVGTEVVSFTPEPDPDRLVTYVQTTTTTFADARRTDSSEDLQQGHQLPTPHLTQQQQPQQRQQEELRLLHGRGLEERFQLAREPLRVCNPCYHSLQPVQEELRWHNAHAMRYNAIDPTHVRRLWNSPIAHTLGHEIRKAAYTLNNLLPQPKRRSGAWVDSSNHYSGISYYNNNNNSNYIENAFHSEMQQCRDTCSDMNPNLGNLDGVRIPAQLLEQAKGVAILTVVKGGFGLAGVEFGTGLVVARLPPSTTTTTTSSYGHRNDVMRWSAPSAIGLAGVSWGALIGAQVSDHVFLLMSDAAVSVLYSNTASVQLGADIGVAVGPVGRTVEGDWAIGDGGLATSSSEGGSHVPHVTAPIYTYSMSKGLYAGISLDGKVIVTRAGVNEKFYGFAVSAQDILAGVVPTPPAAQPLYEALQRCHVYASAAASERTPSTTINVGGTAMRPTPQTMMVPPTPINEQEYGELPTGTPFYEQEYGELPPGTVLPANAVPTIVSSPSRIHCDDDPLSPHETSTTEASSGPAAK